MSLRVLVTGASGLLGRQLTSLMRAHHEVHALVHTPANQNVEDVNLHRIDFSGEWSCNLLPAKVDAVIHLAQSNRFREFPEHALDIFRVNVDSTARLLDYAQRIGVQQFIFASSGGVYGSGPSAFHETSSIESSGRLGYYLGSKLCGEVLVQSYAAHFRVLVLRFFFMYGPGQNRTMLIPRLMDSVKYGRAITLQGPEGIRTNPIHVEDAAAATVAALNSTESATFNVSGPEVLSLRQIAEAMGQFLNVQAQFQILPDQPFDLIGNNTAMREKLLVPTRRLQDHLIDIIR
jgi:UDP-glucose 4-epimerase